jgi:hypothetical protein
VTDATNGTANGTATAGKGRQAEMYGWIWRHLPGNTWVRGFFSLVLMLAVVFVLFQYVFPWAEPILPFNDPGFED